MNDTKRINKLFLFILIMGFILLILEPISYSSSLVNNARNESGSRPSAYSNGDPSSDPNSGFSYGSGESSGNVTIIKSWYRGISGKVYERTDNSSEITGVENPKIGIHGVKVIAYNNITSSIAAETFTNEDGSFNFSDLPEGEYTIQYKYGDTNDTSNIAHALKYNGYDYVVSEVNGNNYTVISNITKTEIERSGKGAMQFVIVLDCSISARTINVTLENGTTKRRLDIEIDATRKLINNLLNNGENIYISLVVFSGDAYRAASLTKDEAYLNSVLDYIQTHDDPLSENTYIIEALGKAEETFYLNNESSNRAIVLVSDGIPTKGLDTSGNVIQVYNTDPDDIVLNTLNSVKNSTINKLQQLVNNDIKLMCLIVKSDDNDEQTWADNIFGNDSRINYISKQDGDELARSIILDIPEWIDKISVSGIDDSSAYILKGFEDIPRRVAVDSKFVKITPYDYTDCFKYTDENGTELVAIKKGIIFKVFKKNNTIIDEENKKIYVYNNNSNNFYYAYMNPINIKNISDNNIASQLNSLEIIDPLNATTKKYNRYGQIDLSELVNLIHDNNEIIEDLGEALYMTAKCEEFHIDSPEFPPLNSTYSYGGYTYELNSDSIVVTSSYESGNYTRYEIGTQINPETGEIENIKTYDATHTLTLKYVIASHTNVNLGITQRPNFTLTTNITATHMKVTLSTNEVLSYKEEEIKSTKMLFECIDSDIAQGTKVEVEYTITVQNNSPYTCHHLELVANLPSELIFTDSLKLLSNPNLTNSKIGWVSSSTNDLYTNGKISYNNAESFKDRLTLVLTKDQKNNEFSLAPNETFEVHVILSRFLSSEDIVSIENDANVEILGYTNNGFRRAMDLVTKSNSGIDTAIGIFPGNTYIDNLNNLHKEIDFSECSNKLALVPPTGGTRDITLFHKIKTCFSYIHK